MRAVSLVATSRPARYGFTAPSAAVATVPQDGFHAPKHYRIPCTKACSRRPAQPLPPPLKAAFVHQSMFTAPSAAAATSCLGFHTSAFTAGSKAQFLRTALAHRRNFSALRPPKGRISAHCARAKAEFLRTALAQRRKFCACPSAFQVYVLFRVTCRTSLFESPKLNAL